MLSAHATPAFTSPALLAFGRQGTCACSGASANLVTRPINLRTARERSATIVQEDTP